MTSAKKVGPWCWSVNSFICVVLMLENRFNHDKSENNVFMFFWYYTLLFQDALILNKASVDRGRHMHLYRGRTFLLSTKFSWKRYFILQPSSSSAFLLTSLISFSVYRFWPLFGVQEANLLVKEIRESGNLVLTSFVDEADKYGEHVLCLCVYKPVACESWEP